MDSSSIQDTFREVNFIQAIYQIFSKPNQCTLRKKFPITGKYGPENTPYLDIFRAVVASHSLKSQ